MSISPPHIHFMQCPEMFSLPMNNFFMHNHCFLLHFTVGRMHSDKPTHRKVSLSSCQSTPSLHSFHAQSSSSLICCFNLIKFSFPQLHWICFGTSCQWPLDKPNFMNILEFWAFTHSILLPKMFFLDKSWLSLNTQWKGHLYIYIKA